MDLRAKIIEVVQEVFPYDQNDREFSPGLSPCVVKYIISENLSHFNSEEESADAMCLAKALRNEPIDNALLVTARPETQWLVTRYAELPDCSRTPWEEVNLTKSLLLLRGGVQQLFIHGFAYAPTRSWPYPGHA